MRMKAILAGIAMAMLLLASSAAASDDHTLGIFGNANGDETINMQDVTCTELIILEYQDKTELADGKYDGTINMQDVTQIELVILGREKELTLIDDIGTIVTVPMPVERIIATSPLDSVRALGAKDRVVGVQSNIKERDMVYFPDLSAMPGIGSNSEPDIEMIVELEPDVIFVSQSADPDLWDAKLKRTGIQVVRLYPRNAMVFDEYPNWPNVRDNIIKLGYLLDEVERAQEYAEWYDSVLSTIDERISDLPEDQKTRVFLEDLGGGVTEREVSPHVMGCEEAGGINIVGSSPLHGRMTEVEWIIEQNPDVYIGRSGLGGYKTDDESEFVGYHAEILGLPGFDQIKAVQDSRVHIISGDLTLKSGLPIGIAYQAKWYYPELCEDVDPQAIHQDFVDRFCPGLDFDVRTQGVFNYSVPAN